MERVGFGPRFLAGLIDGVAMLIVTSILAGIFGVHSAFMGATPDGFSIFAIILALVPLAYSSTEIFHAATPGKQLVKLKIKNQDGSEADQSVLQKRWMIKYCGMLVSLIGTITTISLFGYIGSLLALVIAGGGLMVLSDDKLTLHDKLAKTAVFKIG